MQTSLHQIIAKRKAAELKEFKAAARARRKKLLRQNARALIAALWGDIR
jgi:hypothetical protein